MSSDLIGLSIVAGNMTCNHIVQYDVLCLSIEVSRENSRNSTQGIMSTLRDKEKFLKGSITTAESDVSDQERERHSRQKKQREQRYRGM